MPISRTSPREVGLRQAFGLVPPCHSFVLMCQRARTFTEPQCTPYHLTAAQNLKFGLLRYYNAFKMCAGSKFWRLEIFYRHLNPRPGGRSRPCSPRRPFPPRRYPPQEFYRVEIALRAPQRSASRRFPRTVLGRTDPRGIEPRRQEVVISWAPVCDAPWPRLHPD
jgi:hypothetical protein